jgi:hypothetical protein
MTADGSSSPELTPTQRVLRARIAAHASWAKPADRTARTRPAADAFTARFEREVDPDGELEPAERLRRAESAKKAYFQRLALASSRAREQGRPKRQG